MFWKPFVFEMLENNYVNKCSVFSYEWIFKLSVLNCVRKGFHRWPFNRSFFLGGGNLKPAILPSTSGLVPLVIKNFSDNSVVILKLEQKQPSELFCKKGVLKFFQNSQENIYVFYTEHLRLLLSEESLFRMSWAIL